MEWAVTLHRLDDGFLGLLPASELQLLENVQIYGRLNSHGSEDAVGAGETAVGWLVWSVSGLPSNGGGRVAVAVAAKVEDEDFGAGEGVPLDQLLDTGPH